MTATTAKAPAPVILEPHADDVRRVAASRGMGIDDARQALRRIDPFTFLSRAPETLYDPSPYWAITFRLAYGLGLDFNESLIGHKLTGYPAAQLPRKEFAKFVGCIGRRGWKSESGLFAMTYETATAKWHLFAKKKLLKPETFTIPILATELDQAREILERGKNMFAEVPALANRISKETREYFILQATREFPNPIRIQAFAANYKTTRSRPTPFVLIDEAGLLPTEGHITGKMIVEALEPSMAQFGHTAKMWIISTPLKRRGILWEHYVHRHEDPDCLFVQGASTDFNPTLIGSPIIERARRDPVYYLREYGAQFSATARSLIDREWFLANCVREFGNLPPNREHDCLGAVDLSGGKSAEHAVAIGHHDRELERFIIDAVFGFRDASPESAIKTIAEQCRQFGVTRITGDHYLANYAPTEFRKHGIIFEPLKETQGANRAYRAARPYIMSGRVEFPNEEKVVNQALTLEEDEEGNIGSPEKRTLGDDRVNACASLVVFAFSPQGQRGRSISGSALSPEELREEYLAAKSDPTGFNRISGSTNKSRATAYMRRRGVPEWEREREAGRTVVAAEPVAEDPRERFRQGGGNEHQSEPIVYKPGIGLSREPGGEDEES